MTMVMVERGQKADEVLADQIPGDEPIYPGMTYEINHVLEFNKEVDERQAGVLINGFFRRWTNQHPNLKVEYQAIRSASEEEAQMAGLDPQKSYTTVTQVKRPSEVEEAFIVSLPSAAAIGAAITTILGAITFTMIAKVALIAATVMGLWLIYETTTYVKETITGEEEYVCRKHDEPKHFDEYAALKRHYQRQHPNEEVPPKKEGMLENLGDVVLYSTVAIGGAMVLSSVLGD